MDESQPCGIPRSRGSQSDLALIPHGQPNVQSQITFLYYRQLQPVSEFYREIMGFELVEDQGWAKMILRVSGNAYLGIADEERGFCKAILPGSRRQVRC